MKYLNQKEVEEFYKKCPIGYGVEENRVFDQSRLEYVVISMRYIKLF